MEPPTDLLSRDVCLPDRTPTTTHAHHRGTNQTALHQTVGGAAQTQQSGAEPRNRHDPGARNDSPVAVRYLEASPESWCRFSSHDGPDESRRPGHHDLSLAGKRSGCLGQICLALPALRLPLSTTTPDYSTETPLLRRLSGPLRELPAVVPASTAEPAHTSAAGPQLGFPFTPV